jgi:hypothetical protein
VTDLEIIELAAWLLSSWASGFCMGLVLTTFRKIMDKI